MFIWVREIHEYEKVTGKSRKCKSIPNPAANSIFHSLTSFANRKSLPTASCNTFTNALSFDCLSNNTHEFLQCSISTDEAIYDGYTICFDPWEIIAINFSSLIRCLFHSNSFIFFLPFWNILLTCKSLSRFFFLPNLCLFFLFCTTLFLFFRSRSLTLSLSLFLPPSTSRSLSTFSSFSPLRSPCISLSVSPSFTPFYISFAIYCYAISLPRSFSFYVTFYPSFVSLLSFFFSFFFYSFSVTFKKKINFFLNQARR